VRELKVLEKSKLLVYLVYDLTNQLPNEEKFGLISQINRAVVSVPSNIAEGSQRTNKDFNNFLRIARGSLSEVKVQLELIKKLYKIENKEVWELIEEIGKMTYSLQLKLKTQTLPEAK